MAPANRRSRSSATASCETPGDRQAAVITATVPAPMSGDADPRLSFRAGVVAQSGHRLRPRSKCIASSAEHRRAPALPFALRPRGVEGVPSAGAVRSYSTWRKSACLNE